MSEVTIEEYQTKKREAVAKLFASEKAMTAHAKTRLSPSGKYRLVVTPFETKPGCWSYTQGSVFEGDRLIAEVNRNYGSFEWEWCEDHPKGDFLICGEDYQGQTVIELRSGARRDYLPSEAMKGYGFCWVQMSVSPDKTKLAVAGCYWGAPYELRVYDFSDPLNLPYRLIDGVDYYWDFKHWNPDGSITYAESAKDIRKSDGKLIDDLPEEEWPEDSDWGELETLKTWTPKEKNNENQN